MPDKLKPCPFCGSPAAEPFKTIRGNKLYTECSECGAGMMTVAAWNHRAPSPEVEGLVEAVYMMRSACSYVADGGNEAVEVCKVAVRRCEAALTAYKEAQR